MISGILTGLLSGIISGMGIGGGAILIPALIMLENVNQQVAQGINLVYFIPTAVVSLIVHIRRKNVEIKTALIIGAGGISGAVFGSIIAKNIHSGILGKLFGIFLLGIGIYEIVKGLKKGD